MNNPLIRSDEEDYEYTQEMIEELKKCKKDPIYFIENYIQVISEQKLIYLKLREYQIKYINMIHRNTSYY